MAPLIHHRRPARLWLFVPIAHVAKVLALRSKYRDLRVANVEGDLIANFAEQIGLQVLSIGEKYGTYQGVVGGRPVITRNTGVDESTLRAKIARQNPSWSQSKVSRAVRDICRSQQRNEHTDYERRDYKRLWRFLCEIVENCDVCSMIYDDGCGPSLPTEFPSSAALRDAIRASARTNVECEQYTALYDLRPKCVRTFAKNEGR